MFRRIQQYALIHYGGRSFRPRVYGALDPDGSWGGWIVFFPLDGSDAVATDRETTQGTLESLSVWAARLTRVHLEDALVRALHLAAQPLVLSDLDRAEYGALEDAETLQTVAELERVSAKIDEAAAEAARFDAAGRQKE